MDWLNFLGWDDTQIKDLRSLAYRYVEQGIYEVALTFFDALTILAPENAYDLQMLGAIHLQLGQGLKALDYLDRALKLDPSHQITQLNRAKTLFMLGYKRQGLAQASELEKSPNPNIADPAKALILTHAMGTST